YAAGMNEGDAGAREVLWHERYVDLPAHTVRRAGIGDANGAEDSDAMSQPDIGGGGEVVDARALEIEAVERLGEGKAQLCRPLALILHRSEDVAGPLRVPAQGERLGAPAEIDGQPMRQQARGRDRRESEARGQLGVAAPGGPEPVAL